MEYLMLLVLLALVGVQNAVCFYLGARIGQQVHKGEEVKLPTVNPMEAYRVHNAKKEAQKELDIVSTILQNVENYDGTGKNQVDVPGR